MLLTFSSAVILPTLAALAEDDKAGQVDVAENEPAITNRVFIDLQQANGRTGRLTIALYGTVVPDTVDNFLRLIDNGYRDTKVYRVVNGLTIQLGDVLRNGGKSGRAATETGVLEAENYRISHSVPGILSMVVKDGMVDSRFFVTTRPGDSRYLDGRYVAFGRVESGMDTLYELDRIPNSNGFVRRPVSVRIASCGRVEHDMVAMRI